jgi:Asp-tRNA(Asn)/Glu-tRNA(Gln) amidotransferase A subunit family amidase
LELRDKIAGGAIRATDLARACLDQVRAVDGTVRAWAWLDESYVMAEAERLDTWQQEGRALGPLHGLPVAVKDIIDTASIPTTNGTSLDEGRVPASDASVVQRLKVAGGYVFGKTVTAELAFLHPGPTTNPHDASRTPGGSSQGSAAAVAAGMVPFALGTQTGGSIIRPASFCGVTGYKPTFGMISRAGILAQSPSLDTVGVISSSLSGAAMLVEALAGDDLRDIATKSFGPPRLLSSALSVPPDRPTLAVLPRHPGADLTDDMVGAMEELTKQLGEEAFLADLPSAFAQAADLRETINFTEMSECYHPYERKGREQISDILRRAIDKGRAISRRDYLAALEWPSILNGALDEIFARCDAILCPAALGAAPSGLQSTGSAVCNGLWTLCGVPVVTVPLFRSFEGLPMGIQLVGRVWDDARLLGIANWLSGRIAENEGAAV